MSSYLIKTIVLAFKAVSGTAPSTPKHWSDNTSQRERFALLHQLTSWYRQR